MFIAKPLETTNYVLKHSWTREKIFPRIPIRIPSRPNLDLKFKSALISIKIGSMNNEMKLISLTLLKFKNFDLLPHIWKVSNYDFQEALLKLYIKLGWRLCATGGLLGILVECLVTAGSHRRKQ